MATTTLKERIILAKNRKAAIVNLFTFISNEAEKHASELNVGSTEIEFPITEPTMISIICNLNDYDKKIIENLSAMNCVKLTFIASRISNDISVKISWDE